MSGSYCAVNGEILDWDGRAISVKDRSFMLGDGLFETVRVIDGKPVWLEEHLQRMERSASFSGISFAPADACPSLCAELIDKNRVDDGFLRITLSRGSSPGGRFADFPSQSTLAVMAGVLQNEPDPARAGFAPWPVNEHDPACAHKSCSRFSHVLAHIFALRESLDELVFANSAGNIAEAVYSNVFWVKGCELYTPSLDCGVLPGITRMKLINGRLLKREGERAKAKEIRRVYAMFLKKLR